MSSKISIHPVQPGDHRTLAQIEADAFGPDDEFNCVAFGPHRFDDTVLSARAKEIAKGSSKPGETIIDVKAVDESGRIVGWANWVTVVVGEGGVGVYGVEKADMGMPVAEGGVKLVVNEKVCDDLFVPGDQCMARVCVGGDYHKLFTLVVAPDCQRRGIGTLLLEDGLKLADSKGLQCVLGASPEGLGLYKKHGFVVVEEMSLNLWEYEGGEGLGVIKHCIMYRPAKASESSKS